MNDDPLFWISGSDTEMKAAIENAQRTFPEFAKELEIESRRIVPALDEALVKAFFFEPGTPEQGEHMFVDEVRLEGKIVHGVLVGTPQFVTSLSEGQRVSIPVTRISDWFIVINGRGKGGHTLGVIAKQMGTSAYRKVANEPPFSWFAWRKV